VVRNIEYYRILFYNGVKLPKDKMWLVVLASKNYQELFENLGYVVNDEVRNKIMREVIEMFSDGFSLELWKIEHADKLNEIVRMSAYNDGVECGLESGIEQGVIQTIKSMLKKNLSIDMISDITKKSISEIEEIQKSIN